MFLAPSVSEMNAIAACLKKHAEAEPEQAVPSVGRV
jgi:hypothetical protein